MVWRNGTVIKEFVLLGLSRNQNLLSVLFIVFLITYLIILIANSLIILVTVTDNKLHTPMYFFLTNLSLVDILYSTSIAPRMLRDMLAVNKTILFMECVAQMYISVALGAVECLLLAVLAYDRYIAICFPLHYNTIINQAACIKIAAGTWICGFLLTDTPVFLTLDMDFCEHNVINHFFCELPGLLSLECGNITNLRLVIFVFGSLMLVAPISFIVLTYIYIIRAIFQISSSTGRKKTFSTCGSHIIVVTMFYGSGTAAFLNPRSKLSPDTGKMFAVFYAIFTPMLNPLIYTLRNKEVKSALKRFHLKKSYVVRK
ncbi:olfactory receptor 2B6-like [Gastrophryne carolinensis]